MGVTSKRRITFSLHGNKDLLLSSDCVLKELQSFRSEMAEQPVQVDRDTFNCSICLDLLKDPVTIPCGHSYCLNCIESYWNHGHQRGIHNCPQCKKTFSPRPILEKSIMLAAVAEQLRRTELQHAADDHNNGGPEAMLCDFCTGRQLNAIMSCLICQASYCGEHLQPHYDMLDLESHILVEPISNLQQIISPATESTETLLFPDIEIYADDRILLSEPEPKTRDDFLRYSREITLDPNTAHPQLLLSEDSRNVTYSPQQHLYHSHPDRFTTWFQVLSRESLTGRCYWEVEWRGMGISVAVAYKNIRRGGDPNECGFGHDENSWALLFNMNSISFWHNNRKISLSDSDCSRVGVYLDHRAGDLFFYNISHSMSLLYRVQATFTRPLHAGVRMYNTALSAEFCRPR